MWQWIWARWHQRQVDRHHREQQLNSLIAAHVDDDLQVGEFYLRTGSCTQCGKCCENIHLAYKGRYIAHSLQFRWLQLWSPEFRHFSPMGYSEQGVVFKCLALGADNTCTVYGARPGFCKRYPSENVMLLGRELPEDCGYSFKPIESFSSVITRQAS
jgi:Fe-S-cluster containining protein